MTAGAPSAVYVKPSFQAYTSEIPNPSISPSLWLSASEPPTRARSSRADSAPRW